MRVLPHALVVVIACASAGRAQADDGDAPAATLHGGQFGLSLRFGVGLRAIATYNDNYCGQSSASGNTPVCTGLAPLAMDLEASYGVRSHIELALALTIGLQRDFGATPSDDNGARPLSVAGGARFFFSEATHTQLFVQPMLVADLANYTNSAGKSLGDDFGERLLGGFWVDLHRAYGFYVYVGETVEVLRWLDGEVDAGIGIQGRYP
jgi:hypothetical protein